jgi:hypothetical protein
MIRINKSNVAIPTILTTRGVQATNRNKHYYSKGKRKFTFSKNIYGHPSVKNLLINIQHDKCCFCERKVSAGEPGHVEHYRPKGGYKQSDTSALVKPGYYWLAYDFDNLYFSCYRCNATYKKNYFPLSDPGQRATCHTDLIANEDPLIINPADDPSIDLYFDREVIKYKNPKGEETIKRTGLNRRYLLEERFEYLHLMDFVAKVARGTDPYALEAQNQFRRAARKESLFSYMIRCNYPDLV